MLNSDGSRVAEDLTGRTFGKWTVLREGTPQFHGARKNKARFWACRCVCGRESEISASDLRKGRNTQCRSCAAKAAAPKVSAKLPPPPTTRVCRGCSQEFPLTEEHFPPAKHHAGRVKLRYYCWECHNAKYRVVGKRHRDRLREEVFAAYGGKCACCGIDGKEFLGLDHVGGGGKAHRKSVSESVYSRVKKEGFPSKYRLLCHNCNCSIGFRGYCPHRPDDPKFHHTVEKARRQPKTVCDDLDKATKETKVCFKCGGEFPLNENWFYRHKYMGDGFLGKCRECARKDVKVPSLEGRRALREAVLQHYSGGAMACACCGESHEEFLQVDHVNGGGRKDRLNGDLYSRLRREGFPEGFQILCANCNLAKGSGSHCPHQKPAGI